MMKKTIILFFALFTSVLIAQEEESKERKHALGLSVGSGIGIDYSYKLNKYFSVSARYSTLQYTQEDFEYELDGETLSNDAELDFSHIDAFVSIAPFGKAFRFVLGAGYFTSNQLDVLMSFTEEVSIGDVTFTPDDVGNIAINADWGESTVLPYLGIAFGRAVPKKGLGFGLELGAYYAADGPTMTLEATGLIEETSNQQSLLQESFEENKFLPYLSFRLAYSF